MQSIGQVLKDSLGIGQEGPLETSNRPDFRKTEIVKIICSTCGQEFTSQRMTNRSGHVWEPPTTCPSCAEKKRFEAFRQTAEANLPSEVDKQKQKWFRVCQLPSYFLEKAQSFDSFDGKIQPRAYQVMTHFNGKSIILFSPDLYGVGKTHLACCLAWHLLEHTESVGVMQDGGYKRYPCPVYFTTESILLSRIRETYNRSSGDYGETEQGVYNFLSSFEVLIIDDVGKVRPRDNAFLQGVYFRIIDERYTGSKVIIITTNLNLNDLEAHIGGACADRLYEMCGKANIVKMEGSSYRHK